MKLFRITTCILFLCAYQSAVAQLGLYINSGIKSSGYGVGENLLNRFPTKVGIPVGVELEYAFRAKKMKPVYLAVRTGASLFGAGYSYVRESSSDKSTSVMEKKYVQVPLIFRLYFQPMPLVDHLTLFFGAGVSMNFISSVTLSEQESFGTTNFKDSGDISAYSKAPYPFRVMEFGMNYKRLQISYRISNSLTNLYFEGLSKTWKVPAANSYYLRTHADGGNDGWERLQELQIAYRIF